MKRYLEHSLNLLCIFLLAVGAFAYFRDRSSVGESAKHVREQIKLGRTLSIPNVAWSAHRSLVLALSTTCHFCEQSASFYQRLLSEQVNRPSQSVLLFPQPLSQAQQYVTGHHYVASTVAQADFGALGITGTPTAFLVDEHGTVLDEWIGLLSSREEADVAAHLGLNPNVLSNSTKPESEDSPSDLSREVLAGELSAIFSAHQPVMILDVRPRNEFGQGHLSGAVNIPADELRVRAVHELSKQRTLLLYCNFAPQCAAKGVRTLCAQAEQALGDDGFKGVRYVRDRLPLLAQEGFAIGQGAPAFVMASR